MDAFEDRGGSEYLGVVLDVGFYGLHIGLYSLFIGVHLSRGTKSFRGVANIASSVTFALSTVYVILHATDTYINLTGGDHPNFDLINKLSNASSVLFSLIDFVAQILLVYRCWYVWDKRHIVVVLPTLLALTSLWSGWMVIILVNTRTFTESLDNILGALAVVSFATSMSVTGMVTLTIVTRIWYLSQQFPSENGRLVHRRYGIAAAMFLESGATVMVAQLICVVLFQIGNAGYGVVSGATTQIYGFTPTIILIRIGLGKSYDRNTLTSPDFGTHGHSAVDSGTRFGEEPMLIHQTVGSDFREGENEPEKHHLPE